MNAVLDYKEIGARIRSLRKEKGMYQAELAECLEMSQTHMSNIESGKAGITLENLAKLMNEFNCSSDYLIFGREPVSEEQDWEILKHCSIEDLLKAIKILRTLK